MAGEHQRSSAERGGDSPWPIPQVLPAPAPVCDSSGARRPVGRLKNALLTPDQVSAQSGRKIWWQCEKGHVWQSTINKRIRGDGCPYCSGHRPSKEYCLQTCYPAIAAQWHPERNKGLTPRDVTPGSGRNVWWQCEKGHEWKASVSNRSRRGHNCPYCADRSKRLGSVAEARPDLLGEWNYGKNTKTPQDCSARSNKKVWWKCSVCGHAWQASPTTGFAEAAVPSAQKAARLRGPVGWFSYTSLKFQNIDFNRPLQRKKLQKPDFIVIRK